MNIHAMSNSIQKIFYYYEYKYFVVKGITILIIHLRIKTKAAVFLMTINMGQWLSYHVSHIDHTDPFFYCLILTDCKKNIDIDALTSRYVVSTTGTGSELNTWFTVFHASHPCPSVNIRLLLQLSRVLL